MSGHVVNVDLLYLFLLPSIQVSFDFFSSLHTEKLLSVVNHGN